MTVMKGLDTKDLIRSIGELEAGPNPTIVKTLSE
ncbi:hypothetical protein RUA4292_02661 [Ruegeria atlantica]|uniref:Uncharacterized protein n=1 Tax=Ruegeria atlantica TaxID=81569 RepID=A0A0P1EES9_9RHOB|nr:hypothetical protein RUA4292_02661 [Ruegeria atlantica]